ncbi:MAG: hypothetical protein QM535_21040 [Limnohabitans sp.]|nr:hypothetical protein [Limnohabitans sp.]
MGSYKLFFVFVLIMSASCSKTESNQQNAMFGSPIITGYKLIDQNGMHQSNSTPDNQNYYLNYQHFNSGLYLNGGYYNNHSLYGF